MPLPDLLAEAYAIARREHIPLTSPYPCCTLFFSVSSGKERARVMTASGEDFEQAWRDGSAHIQRDAERLDAPPRWLRVDWVFTAQSETWAGLDKRLTTTKRNYFRFGLALDAGFTQAVTEQELNANAMLYPGATQPAARLNPKNFTRYVQQRFGSGVTPDFSPDTPVWVLSTRGVFCEAGAPARLLTGPGRNAGRRVLPPLDADSTLDLVTRASRFLARQVQPDGRFIYGYHPCFDRRIPSYNALRHASTTYSMVEAWELTREAELEAAIERALNYLVEQLIQRTDTPDGVTRAFVVDTGNEIKLGANAVAILALTKYREVAGSDDHADLLEQLALGIEYMQDPETGAFRHVIAWPDLALRDAFRIIYYDGEAAFGLMRLYGQTRDPRWLAMVERAFEHFIASGHEDAHDHWLSYCVNELTLHRPDERLFRFGLRNVAGHLDFVIERITTFPTLLELMMAAERMLRRIDSLPEHRHLLAEIDLEKFYRALHTRANYLLNGHFWPEIAMFFARPESIVDSFFIRHHSFRVRIDDVEHYLSGLVAYWKYLREGQPRVASIRGTSTRDMTQARVLKPGERGQGARKDLENCNEVRTFFLNRSLRLVRTGIENAALLRARVFCQELRHAPLILTTEYDSTLESSRTTLKREGLLPQEVLVLNMYEHYQEITSQPEISRCVTPEALPEDWVRSTINGSKDIRLRNSKCDASMYCRIEIGTGRLAYINHFVRGQKCRRDTYDTRGFLSRIQFLDRASGAPVIEQFLRPDGSIALIRQWSLEHDSTRLSSIHLLDRSGAPRETFDNEADLMHHWLCELTHNKQIAHVMIVDRNQELLMPSIRVKLERPESNIVVLPHIHSLHVVNGEPSTGKPRAFVKKMMERHAEIDGIITLTDEQATDIAARFGIARPYAIPHATVSRSQSDFANRRRTRLIYAARYAQEKNHVAALRILAKVREVIPEVHLDCYGSGQEREHIQEAVNSMQLGQHVQLHDFNNELDRMYREAGLTIVTSRSEGFSLTIKESLELGCPVVAFDVPYGPATLIRNDVNGYLIPFGNEAAFANKVIRIMQDEVLHERLSASAAASIAPSLGAPAIAKRWATLFSKLGIPNLI